jgi:hypothetical protein
MRRNNPVLMKWYDTLNLPFDWLSFPLRVVDSVTIKGGPGFIDGYLCIGRAAHPWERIE